MAFTKTTIEEITKNWHASRVVNYNEVYRFLVSVGLAKDEIFIWDDKDDVWYVPARGRYAKDDWFRYVNLELNLITIEGKRYWTIWFD